MAYSILLRGYWGHDHMVVGFTTTKVTHAYHHQSEFKFHLWRGVLNTTLCDKVCQ
jgi:hypothetical protein